MSEDEWFERAETEFKSVATYLGQLKRLKARLLSPDGRDWTFSSRLVEDMKAVP